ncbi:UNKNOWN [Stylonychia lemnae]|uniref:Anaphase-promoting complex subunit 4 n=1 Tax=Stylonychia lemnae TaxID=5949 RepID=A0A078APQ9_STYLE|nr:UNKNOWN [Stylonychia lemnae]|eukprot:CDW83287.1 UNKNOWN [Stylonychia lemnae]
MDLIGLISTSDHSIEVHRVGFKHQKVFQKEDLLGPTSLEFTKNGKQVIIGYEDGKVSIIKSDDSAYEIFATKIVDDISPITAICYQEAKQYKSPYIQNDKSGLHIKPLQSIDSKVPKEIIEKIAILSEIQNPAVTQSSIVYTADASLNISLLYQGHFPIACFKIKDILPHNTFASNLILKIRRLRSTDTCDQLMTLAEVFNADNQIQGAFLLNIDTRVISSRILKQDSYLKLFSNFPMIEEYVRYLEQRIEMTCKTTFWQKIYKSHTQVINFLKPESRHAKSSANPISEQFLDVVVKGKISPLVQKFLTDENYNTKILQRHDENTQLVFSNIEDEITDKIIPVIEKTLLLLSELRGLVKSKSLIFPQNQSTSSTQHSMFFSFNEAIIQKLIDFMNYLFHQVQQLLLDIIEAKVEIRNFLVYCNTMVLKLANANHQQSQQTNPLEIENAKSHLAKLVPDQNRLITFLEKGDAQIGLQHIQKQFEEGQFKLPIDAENQIVQGFNSEDLIGSLKQLQKQEEDEIERQKQNLREQSSHQMINIQQVNAQSILSQQQMTQVITQQIFLKFLQNSSNRRQTRRSHLSSGDYTSNQRPAAVIRGQIAQTSQLQNQQIDQQQIVQQSAQSSNIQIIPLKTLTTRILDLIHKQMRKPLESLSPYFRYLQLFYFENVNDRVLDSYMTHKDCHNSNQFYMVYSINNQFLMIIQQDLQSKRLGGNRVSINYQMIQVPDEYLIKECVFHFNSMSVRDSGKCKEEIIILCQSVAENESIVKVIELQALFDDFNNQHTINMDQHLSFKFGIFAREQLQKSLNQGRVPMIEFDERCFKFQSKNIHSLRAGSRGLFNVIQDTRDLIVRMTDNE